MKACRITHVLLLMGCLASAHVALSQERRTLLHLAPLHFEKLFKYDGFAPIAFRVSIERELEEKLSIGLDAHVLWRTVTGVNGSKDQSGLLEYAGWYAEYETDKSEWGVHYRTAYFLTGDVEAGIYLGSVIGLRMVTREIIVDEPLYSWGYSHAPESPFRERYSATRLLVPLGLRLGFRGARMWGVAPCELYFGLSYQLGGGKDMFDEPELSKAPAVASPLAYTLGLAFLIELK